MIAMQAEDLPLALFGRRYEEDLVSAGAAPIVEVAGVSRELCSKATRLFGAAIPLEMNEHLALRCEESAPSVWDRCSVIAFGVGVLDAVFADPVVETAVRYVTSCRDEVYEELVCFQVVDEMEPPLERVLSASHERTRFDIEPFREGRRAPPRQKEDRGAADTSGSHDHSPCAH